MDGISEYEMERRRKMERNHRRLQELGLVGRGEPWKDPRSRKAVKPQRKAPKPTATASVSASAEGVAVRKSVRARRKPAPVYVPPAPPARALRGVAVRDYLAAGIAVRKSSRTKSKASPSCRDHDTDSGVDESNDPALSRGVGEDSGDEEAGFGSKRSRDSPAKREEWTPSTVAPPAAGALRRAPTPLAPNSSRNLECDIPMLMERYLGRQFPSFGKAPVMELSTKSWPPKFSRMSGVTEWKNAVFLWVNVDGGSSYENLFERDPSPQEAASADDTKAPGDDPAAATAAATRQTNQVPTGSTESAPVGGDWRLPRNPRRGATASSVAPVPADGPPPAGNNDNSNDNGDAQSGARASDPAKETTTTTAAGAAAAAAAAVSRPAGLRMTWFAGGRVTAESALIQRLLLPENPPKPKTEEANDGDSPSERPASENDDGGGGGGGEGGGAGGGGDDVDVDVDVDALLLFCRLPNEPYVFCGRLGYSEHWADERPIRFVWRLLDAERLAGSPDFEAVVEVAGVE